ncbi:thiopurine S-methyltransferase, partial [Clarias magur]
MLPLIDPASSCSSTNTFWRQIPGSPGSEDDVSSERQSDGTKRMGGMLKDNLDKVLCGRQQVRVFFPLCGKAVDMKWLADMGHIIVGVEISEKAIKQFFAEHVLEYKEEPVPAIPGAKVFKSLDARISLYQCDLYKFSSAVESQFGGIWDRGSLVAINPCDRRKYATLIMSLMDNDCRYLLDTLEYNPELYKGPPFFVPEDAVKSLY